MLTGISVLAYIVILILEVMTSTVNSSCPPPTKCLAPTACDAFDGDFVYPCIKFDESFTICCNEKSKPVDNTSNIWQTDKNFLNDNKTVVLFAQNCGENVSLDDRIIGGNDSSVGEFPWLALLMYKAQGSDIAQFGCGGSLINSRYVITAAHCLYIENVNLTSVRLGELDTRTAIDCTDAGVCADPPKNYTIEKVTPHEDYQRSVLQNDIALIRLSGDVEFTDWIKPICLPFNINIGDNYYDAKTLLIAGWGKTDSDAAAGSRILQKASVRAWTHTACEKIVPPNLQPLSRTQLCAGGSGQDVCKGDSGGPLMQINSPISSQFLLVGVVSLGLEDSCGEEEIPSIYTRVNLYLDWIVDNMDV